MCDIEFVVGDGSVQAFVEQEFGVGWYVLPFGKGSWWCSVEFLLKFIMNVVTGSAPLPMISSICTATMTAMCW